MERDVDDRRLRFERALAAVVLLAGYVWQRDLVIPVVAIAMAVPLLPSTTLRPFAVPFDHLLAPRLGPPSATIAAARVKAGDLLSGAVLAVASILLVADLGLVARNIALVVAAALALEAAAAISVAGWIMTRVRDRKH